MRIVSLSLVLAATLALMAATAHASSPAWSPLARSSGLLAQAARSNSHCSIGQTALNVLNPFSSCEPLHQAAGTAVHAVTSIPGTVAGDLATGIMDQVTSWMVGAAQTITGWVFKEAAVITKPELDARWYLRLFSSLAALGGALAGLVALIALGSAAIRRDPEALGEVLYGIGRAGIGTSIVVALTIIALTVADGIANGFAQQMPADFYKTLASQWGGSGWGGFGAAALAFLVAFIATIAGLLVWLELIVREAAIYIAVLFFPVALAASIWPALRMWVRRLGMLLLMFVMLRPVVVIVLALAGSVTSAGLTLGDGSIPHSVGTILAGVVIFALAAFTPWSLMFLVGSEIGVMYSRGSATSGASSSGRTAGGTGGPVGGAVASGPLVGGGPELAAAGVGAGSTSGGDSGGLRLASLGGSGTNGAGSSGPISAAAGWMAGVGGSAGRLGGQLSQHAAARIQVASGRSGVAPNGLLPVSDVGYHGSGGDLAGAPSREPLPSNGVRPGGSTPFAEGLGGPPPPPESATAGGSPESPSPVDTAVAAAPPGPTPTSTADPSPARETRTNPGESARREQGGSGQSRDDR